MMLDNLDMFIIEMFYKKEITSTWEMAKEFYKEECPRFEFKSEEDEFYTKKLMCVEYRIKKMIKEGIIIKEEDGEKVYVLDTDRVRLQKHKLPNGYKECVLIKDKEDKWMVFQN